MVRLLLTMGVAAAGVGGMVTGCSSDANAVGTTASDSIPAIYAQFGNGVAVARDGNYIVLTTTDVPDHKSVYFPTTDSRYQAYNGANPNFSRAPSNTIVAQQMTFRIPAAPLVATSHAATPLGPIGVAVDGVALFNQYNGQNNPLTFEVNSFDQWSGHPTPNNVYHYHVEPTWITSNRGSDVLIGVLLDGFPVYGPVENGKTITNADLDQYHGHTSVTKDFPAGIYHYHITAADPYINGSGFYGTAGTVSQ